MKRSLFVLITAIAAVLLFVACSPETKESAPTYDDLVGTWIYYANDGDSSDYIKFEFDANKSASLTEHKSGETDNCWTDTEVTVSGSTVTIKKDANEWKYTFEFKNGELVLKQDGDVTWLKYHDNLKEFTFDKYCTVTFNYDNGTSSQTKQVKKGDKVAKPADPTKADNMFMGWVKTDDTAYDFDAAVNGDITIKATWKVPTAEDMLEVLYNWTPTDRIGTNLYYGFGGLANVGDITATKVEDKMDDIKEYLTEALTWGSERYFVVSVDSTTASGEIVSLNEFRNVYLCFTYKKQNNTGTEKNPVWEDATSDSGIHTGYVAFSYKLVQDNAAKTVTASNIESSIQGSSFVSLPVISSSDKKSYKTMVSYLDSTGEDANIIGYSLGGAKLSDSEFNIVKNATSNL